MGDPRRKPFIHGYSDSRDHAQGALLRKPPVQEPTLWAIRAGNRSFTGTRIPAIAHRVRSYRIGSSESSRNSRSGTCITMQWIAPDIQTMSLQSTGTIVWSGSAAS